MDRMPKKNLTAKILALIAAIILWVYVMNEQNPIIESFVEVPLEVKSVSRSLVASEMPDMVRVKVRGQRNAILVLSSQEVKAFVDASGLKDGHNNVKVHVTVPSGLEVMEVSPEKVDLKLEAVASRQIPVEVWLSGTPPDGLVVSGKKPGTELITIEGPKSLLDTVEKAVTHVNVSGRTADFSVRSAITLLNASGKEVTGLSLSITHTNVMVTMAPGNIKKLVDVKVNLAGEMAKGTKVKQITTIPAKIEISGNKAAVEKTEYVFTEPVNLSGVERDTELAVKLQAKEGIIMGRNTVTVHIITGQ